MTALTIEWTGDLSFVTAGDGPRIAMASGDPAILSPMQVLAHAVMGCMGMDVAYVLGKGRYQLGGMTVRFQGERAQTHPRRYTAVSLHFDVKTSAAPEAVARAIELSRTKYCAVWHTLRPDVTLETSFTTQPVDPATASDPL
jgi:putative redox protein